MFSAVAVGGMGFHGALVLVDPGYRPNVAVGDSEPGILEPGLHTVLDVQHFWLPVTHARRERNSREICPGPGGKFGLYSLVDLVGLRVGHHDRQAGRVDV
ncbi:MAG: hypothetical protein FWD63_05165 [Propionibacteriaceae bacterium]|nr:hypothetical protein [Propionibacteriaceae bacterium]